MSDHLPTCGRGCPGGDYCEVTWLRATYSEESRIVRLRDVANKLVGADRFEVLCAIDDLKTLRATNKFLSESRESLLRSLPDDDD